MLPPPDYSLSSEEYDALTRIDFWTFVQRVFAEIHGQPFADNWHIQLLCAEVDRIRTTPNTKLAIALPPRSLKSEIVSVALPAWLLGHNPGLQIVCASYGQELSDELAPKCRQIMLTPWYGRLFPRTRLERQAMGHLVTSAGGKRYATSVGGALTGMGADVIIVDDPIKPDDVRSDSARDKANEWARHTLFTRLNNKSDGRLVIVHQRLHEDDMIGHVMELDGFELLSFPAIAQEDELHVIRTPFGNVTRRRLEGEALHPLREPLDELEKQRKRMGTEFFAAQYLQSPTPPGGGIVKTDWLNRYDPVQHPVFKRIFQSWDCASKIGPSNDFSVCTTWGVTPAKHIYLLHVFRDRLGFPDLVRKVKDLAKQFSADLVLIEDAAAGMSLAQQLKADGFFHARTIKPKYDKKARMEFQTPILEAGRVHIPREAVWLAVYLHELAMFPKGKFDDQVDSTSQALEYFGNFASPDNLLDGIGALAKFEQMSGSGSAGMNANNWLGKKLAWQ